MSNSPTSITDMSLRGLLMRIDRTDLARTAFVAVCVILLLSGVTWPWQQAPAIAIAGLLVGCWPIFFEALHDARERRMSMEASMLIAVFAAAAIGEWRTALIITLFVLIAEILEDLSMQRGQVALTDLMQFLPQSVQTRTDDGAIISVPLSELSTGSTVIIAPGGHIPVDGHVVAGHSTLDQSRITGESLPVDVGPKSPVFAGSINQVGALEIQAEKVGADSSYGRIIEAVHRAQSSPAPAQQLADRLAAWLIYLALGSALITFIITRDWPTTIAVIVVAGACGVVAGTPLAILAAIARAARHGAFIKGGIALEKLSTIDTVIFDKTGTLTVGTFHVIDITTTTNVTEQQLLQLAASAESYSEHPLGQAIVHHAQSHTVDIVAPENFDYQPGCGITAGINGQVIKAGNSTYITDAPPNLAIPPHATAVYVSIDGTYAGALVLADEPRASAATAVDKLQQLGIRVMILSGDQPAVVKSLGERLAIHDIRAGLLPAEKLAAIEAEQQQGHTIAMIGDGINDAPALAHADVGIAMGTGTEVARESADIVLISSDLEDLVQTIQTAKRARRIIMFNFLGTIIVDVVGIALAAIGLLAPMLAAFIHVGSETTFILNSARLIPSTRTTKP